MEQDEYDDAYHAIHVAKYTTLRMLLVRGYDIQKEATDYKKYSNFLSIMKGMAKKDNIELDPDVVAQYVSNTYDFNGNRCIVSFIYNLDNAATIHASEAREFIKEYSSSASNCGIIVSNHGFSKTGYTEIQGACDNVQFFLIDDLGYDIRAHCLQPQFALMTLDESRDFMIRNKVSAEILPKMFITDPIAKYFDAKVGQVFAIHHSGETFTLIGNNYTTHRVVCEDTRIST